MIVKNEAKVIRQCLNSVKNHIHYWVICDTGSTDGTQDVIREFMATSKIPGELHERPWVDFATNRTESLQLAKGKCNYRLIIDADDVLVIDAGSNPLAYLSADSYKIKIRLPSLTYYRTNLIRSDQDWKYVGVLHEYIEGPQDSTLTQGVLTGVEMLANAAGNCPETKGKEKYLADAVIFERALQSTPKNELTPDLERRYVFYLAQSYRDAELPLRSIEAYQRRISMGGWPEEIYISKYWIARQMQMVGKSDAEVIDAYLNAWEYRPLRLEALFHLIKFLRNKNRLVLAFAFSSIGIRTGTCNDILFVEEDIRQWKLLDEYASLAYCTGNVSEAVRAASDLVRSPIFSSLPESERTRISENLKYFMQN